MRMTCEGRDVRLTRKEFGLLVALAECAGPVATRKHLLERAWGHQYYRASARSTKELEG